MFIFERPISVVIAGLITSLIGLLLEKGFTVAAATQHVAAAM